MLDNKKYGLQEVARAVYNAQQEHEKTRVKVYCSECKYCKTNLASVYCNKATTVTTGDWFDRARVVQTYDHIDPDKHNAKNDCKDFEKL